eukprot:scaffold58349_cov75-Attheya_sp.AAC.1
MRLRTYLSRRSTGLVPVQLLGLVMVAPWERSRCTGSLLRCAHFSGGSDIVEEVDILGHTGVCPHQQTDY